MERRVYRSDVPKMKNAPKKRTRRLLGIAVTPQLYAEIERAAAADSRTISAFARIAIAEKLERIAASALTVMRGGAGGVA